jgi:hypothetical protein
MTSVTYRPAPQSLLHLLRFISYVLHEMLTKSQTLANHSLSKDIISQTVDNAMDRAVPSNGDVLPGVSIRNGPVQEFDTPMPDANGVEMNGGPVKRKVRESLTRPSYADSESSEEDNKPLVWTAAPSFLFSIISG